MEKIITDDIEKANMRTAIKNILNDFEKKINAIEKEQLGKTVQAYRFLKAEKRGLNEECVLIPEWVPPHLAYIESIEEVEDIEDYATELHALKEIRRWEKRFGLRELIKSLQEALELKIEEDK